MKKRSVILISALLVIALAVSAWLWAYHHRKGIDNLPSLASLSQMGEEEITAVLTGYRQAQLHELWGEPDGTLFGMFGEIWELDGAYLYVYYDSGGTVELARVHTAE